MRSKNWVEYIKSRLMYTFHIEWIEQWHENSLGWFGFSFRLLIFTSENNCSCSMGLCQNSSWIWWVLLFTIFLTEGLLIASSSFGFRSDISSSFIHFAITRRCAYVSSLFCGRKKIYPELENTGETHSRSVNLFAWLIPHGTISLCYWLFLNFMNSYSQNPSYGNAAELEEDLLRQKNDLRVKEWLSCVAEEQVGLSIVGLQ